MDAPDMRPPDLRPERPAIAGFTRNEATEAVSRCDHGLASLAGGPLTARYCAWHGASERRYVASVYSVERREADAGLPDFEGFVLIGVKRDRIGRRIVAVSAVEQACDFARVRAAGLAAGIDEWHVHFLAADRLARHAAVADLEARHLGRRPAARCA